MTWTFAVTAFIIVSAWRHLRDRRELRKLRRDLNDLAAMPKPIVKFDGTLTPGEERKLREDFYAALRDHWRTR